MTRSYASTDPVDLVHQCFALAKSTTFDGEREAATVRGLKIALKHGLDLSQFTIPPGFDEIFAGFKSRRQRLAEAGLGDDA